MTQKKKRVGTLGLGGNRLGLRKFPEPMGYGAKINRFSLFRAKKKSAVVQ
jgi:hypothetical protein